MAIATRSKPKTTHHKKRTAQHHRQNKHYVKSYLPYLPMAAIIAAGFFINSFLSTPSAVLGEQYNLTQTALLQATNEDRQANQATPLSYSDQLQLAAQAKADDMVKNNYWSHSSPTGDKPWNFISSVGYQYQSAGENLAYGFNDANGINNAWLKSPEHRANLLSTDYREVGFGVAQSSDFLGHGPETIVVAMYALPTTTGTSIPVTQDAQTELVPVSRLETMALPAFSGFIIGLIGTLAVVTVLLRHSIAWRKMLNRGEMFVIHHPVFDTVLVAIAVTTVILTHTVGFIG
jgi:uncharacterized protein YkwD